MTEPHDLAHSPAQRVIRVFISSTFRDMQEDRDHLVKFVFPQLRKLCEARGVSWGEVDLRWGIPDEDRDEVLRQCLEQIHGCRPYFIGLLGQRYGHVPQQMGPDLIESQPWLDGHRDCSITELEILHGVLRDPNMHGQAYFYFRDPDYFDYLPQGRAIADFAPENPRAAQKLAQLKDRIRAARDQGRCLVRENYCTLPELGEWVLKDLSQLIETQFPASIRPDALDREAAEHHVFAESRARIYIGRLEYFARLDAHVAGTDPPMVVTGESGGGKSALLANWYVQHQAKAQGEFGILHFIGATPDSTDATRLMLRVMRELKRHFGLSDEIPVQPGQIRAEFATWVHKIAGRTRVILVLDALNQLEDRDGAPDLGWLPVSFPANWRVILSALPSRSLDALRGRGWREMTVEPLTVPERERFVNEFLKLYGRRLAPDRALQIANADPSGNPLFLRAVLDELRQFGDNERLGERIAHYLSARDHRQLFDRILARWEEDFGEQVVRTSLGLIFAARRGLSEAELRDLLGMDGRPLPQATWLPFYLAAEASLVQRSGLIGFGHDYVRSAVAERYLSAPGARARAHSLLADYFSARLESTERTLDELPEQLLRAGEWKRLMDLLTQAEVFLWFRASEDKHQELYRHWHALDARFDPVDAYREALNQWERDLEKSGVLLVALNELAMFIYELGDLEAAELLFNRALAALEEGTGSESIQTAACLSNVAHLMRNTGRAAEAKRFMERAVAISEEVLGFEDPQTIATVGNLALVLQEMGQIDEAESLMRRALAADEKRVGGNTSDVARDLNNLARLLLFSGRLVEAEPHFLRAVAVEVAVGGADRPLVAEYLNGLATLYQYSGRHSDAEREFRRALLIDETIFGAKHPYAARDQNNLGLLLHAMGRNAEAESLLRQALETTERTFGADHPTVATDVMNLAVVLRGADRIGEAEVLARRSLEILLGCAKAYGGTHPSTEMTAKVYAMMLAETGCDGDDVMKRLNAVGRPFGIRFG